MSVNHSDMDHVRINFFYHPDHLGSTSMVTDAEGNITQHVAYIPYGEVFVEERNGVWNTPYLFNAKELDEETGLYYYGARYLNPKDTRWISVDPLFEKYVGMSPYGYCAGNPVRLVDVDGRTIDDTETNTWANIVVYNAKDKIKSLEKEMQEHPESCDINDMKAQIGELKKTIKDVSDMRKDKRVYKIIKGESGTINVTKVSPDGSVTINFDKDKIDALVHEIRHCGQYAREEMKINYCDGPTQTNDYDIDKEIDAYKAQVAYAGQLLLPKYIENPDRVTSFMIFHYGSNAGINFVVNHVTDIDVNMVMSIRNTDCNLIGKYSNTRLYGSW